MQVDEINVNHNQYDIFAMYALSMLMKKQIWFYVFMENCAAANCVTELTLGYYSEYVIDSFTCHLKAAE